ncbi:MAG: mechanosensitive ion channel domain-containing protein [Hyphomicrobiaceae bacterium]
MVFAHRFIRHGSAVLRTFFAVLAVIMLANAATAQSVPSAGTAAAVKGAKTVKVSRDDALFPEKLNNAIQQQSAEIARLAKSLSRVRKNDAELEVLRPQIEAILAASEASEKQVKPLLDAVDRQIKALGDTPKDGETSETPEIAAVRARLKDIQRQLRGALKQSELTRVRSSQLIARIQSLRLENLGRDLRHRELPPPTSRAHWQKLSAQLPRLGSQIVTVTENWWVIAGPRIHWLFLIIIGAGFLWWALRGAVDSRIRSWVRHPIEDEPPAYLKRVRMAVATLPLMLIPGLVTMAACYLALSATGLLNEQVDTMALAALRAIALYLIASGLAKAILLPSAPSWRLIGQPTAMARRYLWLTRLLAGVYCLDLWLHDVFAALQVPTSIVTATTLIANLAFAALLYAFAWLPTRHGQSEPVDERISGRLLQNAVYWLRLPATLAVAAIAIASLLGYLALGRFVAGQVMLVGISAAALLLGHLAARSIASGQTDIFGSGIDDAMDRRLALSGRRRSIILGTLSLLLNVVLAVGTISLLLISWGFSGAELVGWGRSLLFGFEVGKFRFSLIQILLAVALFVGVIVLTRLFQSWLSRKVLAGERIDRGIANSVHAGIGYAGIALAALIGVSYAGLDLSNIALIASALSIGIGFGLNAIASNFVSGLIMLIERPIKVGDWVVVGPHQGYVRHISVRATEIETFDRASVIIPNSDFMTSAVQNWTHRNAMGRVVVNVGVAYGTDPDEIMTLLNQVAADCDKLLTYPAPYVVFEEFGASSLDFSIRGYIADVNSMLSAKTALRLAITRVFRENDIEIPFPQQDIHLRDLDGVRELVGQTLARRAEEARVDQAMAHGNDNAGQEPDKT